MKDVFYIYDTYKQYPSKKGNSIISLVKTDYRTCEESICQKDNRDRCDKTRNATLFIVGTESM